MLREALILTASAGLLQGLALAHPGDEPAQAGDPAPAPMPAIPVPSLDEALGLAKPGEKPTGPSATQQDLADRLSDVNLEDDFREAIALMNRASARLSQMQDAGLDTQRVQEEAIRRLDQALSKAKKRQQQSSSSSGSSSGKPKPRQDQPSGAQPDQPMDQSSDPDSGASQRQAHAQDSQNIRPPGAQDGQLGNVPAADRAAWGNLPERIRQSLQQGSGEKFSATYQRLTQEYYRRLAEQGRAGADSGAGGGGR